MSPVQAVCQGLVRASVHQPAPGLGAVLQLLKLVLLRRWMQPDRRLARYIYCGLDYIFSEPEDGVGGE